MSDSHIERSAAPPQTKRVSVKLTLAEHKRFKAQAALSDMTMDEALRRAVIEYSSKQIRLPLSDIEKAEQKRINAITDAIEQRAPEIFSSEEVFSSEIFIDRLRRSSTTRSQPSLLDLDYLGVERIQKMLHQKAGTGTTFVSRRTGMYAVRHSVADKASKSEERPEMPTLTDSRNRRPRP